MVERLPYKERVRSSSLLTPTIKKEVTFVTSFLFGCFDSENFRFEVRASRAEARARARDEQQQRKRWVFVVVVSVAIKREAQLCFTKSSNAYHKKQNKQLSCFLLYIVQVSGSLRSWKWTNTQIFTQNQQTQITKEVSRVRKSLKIDANIVRYALNIFNIHISISIYLLTT